MIAGESGVTLCRAGGRRDPGGLITGIRSDLPGQVTAQVTEPVTTAERHYLLSRKCAG